MTTDTHIILLAHGSRDEQWKAPFENLSQTLKKKYDETQIHLAYMEMTTPTLLDAVDHAINHEAKAITILPLFMASGGHLRHDVPQQVQEVQQKYPSISISLQPPIGEHPKMSQAIFEIVQELY